MTESRRSDGSPAVGVLEQDSSALASSPAFGPSSTPASSPYVHDRGDELYSPLSGATLPKGGEAHLALTRIAAGEDPGTHAAVLEHLRVARFLIEDVESETRRSRLLYVSLETCTSCNHRCPFCPVSVAPREMEVMSQELFASIVDQVAAMGEKGVVVFLSNYNEPTVDPLFEERCRLLFEKGLPVTILTNASHFTPERAARLEALG